MALVVWFMLAAITWPTAGTAQAQEVGSAERGLQRAREACADCHLVVKEAGRSTIPGAPAFATVAMTPGLTRAALTAMLQTSHRTMPNVVIEGRDMNDIAAYILSLKERD